MKIKKEIPRPYIVLELRNSTVGQKKEIKTISLEYDELQNIINEVISISKGLTPDFTVIGLTDKGKPIHKTLTVLCYYRTVNKKGNSKSTTLYEFVIHEIYNKILEYDKQL